MSELETRFQAAVENSQSLSRRPSNETLLKLYGLYKQASEGDVSGKRPGFTDLRGRAKYDAWAALAGTPGDEAMLSYATLVERLLTD
mgnify:FL=1